MGQGGRGVAGEMAGIGGIGTTGAKERQRAEAGAADYVSHDLHFHQTLLNAAHNRMMVQMSKALSALLRTSFEVSTAQPGRAAQSLPLHRAILDAVIARDAPRAERASLKLIDSARDDIEAALAARAPAPLRARRMPERRAAALPPQAAVARAAGTPRANKLRG
jgi:DNA-binding FadR family transcriptional regulator